MNNPFLSKLCFRLTLLMAVAILLVSCGGQDDTAPGDTSSAGVHDGPDSVVITIIAGDSGSVLDLTRQSHDVASRSTALGSFVTAIDSVENFYRAFWVYSVNDSFPSVAADNFNAAPGDTVRWHFRTRTPRP